MPEDATKTAAETEKGFGTGLRAQLERRRDAAQAVLDATSAEFDAGKAVADAAPKGRTNGSHPEVEAVRAELQAAIAREQDLRTFLTTQVETQDRELELEEALSTRAAELDEARDQPRAARTGSGGAGRRGRGSPDERRPTPRRSSVRAARSSPRPRGGWTPSSRSSRHAWESSAPASASTTRLPPVSRRSLRAAEAAEAKLERRAQTLEQREEELRARRESQSGRVAERETAVREAEKDLKSREDALAARERELAKEAAALTAQAEELATATPRSRRAATSWSIWRTASASSPSGSRTR